MPFEVNDRINSLRKHLGLSQTAFGQALGVGIGVIKNIEYKFTEPKPEFLALVCKTYNVDPYWLETGDGEMFLEKDDLSALIDFAQDMFENRDLDWIRRLCEYINTLTPEERAEVSRYIKGAAAAVMGQETEKAQE